MEAPASDRSAQKPTGAFVGASWGALVIGIGAYLIGLWNATMQLNEKGFYFTVLLYGLFAAVSLQKIVRDKLDGIQVTGIYYTICWASLGMSIFLLTVGLWNSELPLNEKGFYGISFLLALFASVVVQKNIRDIHLFSNKPSAPDEKLESVGEQRSEKNAS
ncbi:inner membrane protein YiaA [Candidatus Electronema sp. JC]|uniref:inner membrane protein YiaA n=1 Tax=Candidatus Electronema sp. JC TaxID=3401570 RepID=UPI003AA8E6BB